MLIQIQIRVGIKTMLILPKILHILEIQNFIFTYSLSIASFFSCFFFVISVRGVITFSIWTAYLNFLEKSEVYHLYHLLGIDRVPIRIGRVGSGSCIMMWIRPDPDPQHCSYNLWVFLPPGARRAVG